MEAPKGKMSSRLRKTPTEQFANDNQWRGSFFFVQGADPQFGMTDQWKRKKTDSTTISWQEEIDSMRVAVNDINRMTIKPEFFVICGDLVHEFDLNSLKYAQENDFLTEVNKVDENIPLVLIPGNHDVLNTPTPEMIDHFRATFGPDYYSFDARGLRCICINSQYFKEFEEIPTIEYVKLRRIFLDWFDGEIARAKSDLTSGQIKHAILFQHIPWFIKSENEPTDYFNIDIDIRRTYLKKLIDAGISFCFCGHLHKNAVARAGRKGELECVSTSAIGLTLGDDPSGMRLVKVLETEINHHFYALGEMPKEVALE